MKKFILLGIVLCLSTTICACGNKAPSSGTYDKPKVITKEERDAQQAEQEQETTEGQEVEQQPEQTDTTYALGDTANLKDWSITVTDMTILDSIVIDYGQYSPSADNSQYLVVSVIAANNGKQANSFLSSFPMLDDVIAKVIYGDGYEFTSSELIGYDYDLHDKAINPLSSLTGEIVFQVPDVVSNSTEPLLIRFTCENEKVEFKIR